MKKGLRVICIRDDFPAPLKRVLCELPVRGHTYTIRAVQPGRAYLHPISDTSKVVPSILLEELLNPPDPRNKHGAEMGFSADRFAPVDPPLVERVATAVEIALTESPK
jgi:hypothetical protein